MSSAEPEPSGRLLAAAEALLFGRRSVRQYRPDDVPRSLLERVLAAFRLCRYPSKEPVRTQGQHEEKNSTREPVSGT